MKSLYKFVLLLLLFPAITIAGNDKGKYTKSKNLSKEYNLSKTGKVDIDNSFGSVTIKTWDQSKVTFEITVEVSGDNEEDVLERLSDIDVRFSSSMDYVEAHTLTDEHKSDEDFSFWDLFKSGNNNNNGNIKIDYVVRMPVTAQLDLSNDYGAVIIDRLEGRAEIKCDFGRLDIGQLMNAQNELKFDYTKNSSIDYMKSGVIKADFSSFDLYGCEKLDFRGDYTKARLHKVKELNFNCDFTTVETKSSHTIIGRGDYSTIRIGTVENKLDLNTDFGTAKVKELAAPIKEVSIRSDYTGISLGYHPDAQFSFEIDTEYASIKLSADLEVTRSERDGTEKSKIGYAGSPNGGGRIFIKSEFGGVSLFKN